MNIITLESLTDHQLRAIHSGLRGVDIDVSVHLFTILLEETDNDRNYVRSTFIHSIMSKLAKIGASEIK